MQVCTSVENNLQTHHLAMNHFTLTRPQDESQINSTEEANRANPDLPMAKSIRAAETAVTKWYQHEKLAA